MRDASGRRSASLTEDGRDVAPSVDPAQPDLAADNESEEQDERGVFGGQATLGLHTPAELLVEPLNHVCDLERLPLRFGKREERQQFLAPSWRLRITPGQRVRRFRSKTATALVRCRDRLGGLLRYYYRAA
jgi:hypothetical protein